MASEIKTRPTDRDPREFIAELPTQRRRDEGIVLLELFAEVSGEPGRMWGPTMIGFGEIDYTNTLGTNTWFKIGFSPRRAKLSLYGLNEFPGQREIIDTRLGKHTLGVSCLYVNGLRDVDADALRELVQIGWDAQLGISER
ncbi:DUF1801 domain-containing protein [Gulosibacter faecalis]|uniref:DUF1801 domain-containing protein n=1 Tax=Gulosibacter faecalis TaxID=272240 RepID=A0ABW5UZT9_9MICO|nr:DUF1801 domain-containing protein [Gulosibacter faecalis]